METIEVDKKMFEDLVGFLKDSVLEGNSYASMLKEKYKL